MTIAPIAPVRTAHFNRKGFNHTELAQWSKRNGATVLRVTYTASKARVTYQNR